MFLCASPIGRKIRECLLRGHLPGVMEPAGEIYAALHSRFLSSYFRAEACRSGGSPLSGTPKLVQEGAPVTNYDENPARQFFNKFRHNIKWF